MPTLSEFLKHVLPHEGVYCLTVLVGSSPRQSFYKSIDELADAAIFCDQQLDGQVANVYFGTASYQRAGNRTKNNVNKLRAFWLDIDREPKVAIEQLQQFISNLHLPSPTLIYSGRGLHCYWSLTDAIDKETWTLYANRLKAACRANGLAADPARTADCSSIMRPPGCYNRKDGGRVLVTCGPFEPAQPLEAFGGLLSSKVDSRVRPAIDYAVSRSGDSYVTDKVWPLGPKPDYIRNGRHINGIAGNIRIPENVDFLALSNECAQFRYFKDTNGCVSEPIWWACIQTLAHVEDGADIAHEWSSGHPNYTFDETERKLARARTLSGPSTCQQFQSCNPTLCKGCQFGGVTPLEAVRRASVAKPPLSLEEDEELPPMPWGYHRSAAHGVWAERKKKGSDDEMEAALISRAQFGVLSVHMGESKNEHHDIRMWRIKPGGTQEQFSMSMAEISVETERGLAKHGIVVHNGILAKRYLTDAIDIARAAGRDRMSYEQFGWKDGETKFLYGSKLYSANGIENTVVSSDLDYKINSGLGPKEGGSLEGWKNAVDALFAKGSEGMSFVVLASFASVLMRFMADKEGGALVNMMTPHSGAGKSTSLSGGFTVWASDARAISLTTIDTKNSKSSVMALFGNLPVIYDEFTNRDPEVVADFVKAFTEGRDRQRLDQTGAMVHRSLTWQLLLLSATNISIHETLASTGGSDAPAMRVLELPVESSGDLKQSQLIGIARQLSANGGWAGHEFLKYVVRTDVQAWIRATLPKTIDEVMERCAFQKQHRFWARTLAAVSVAAAIVEQLGLVSFSANRIITWALDHFSQSKAAVAYAAGAAGDERYLHALATFLDEHGACTLRMPHAYDHKQVVPIMSPKDKLLIRQDADTGLCYVSIYALRKWLQKNMDGGYSEVVKALKNSGLLHREQRYVTLGAGSEFAGGQVPCLVFNTRDEHFSGVKLPIRDQMAKLTAQPPWVERNVVRIR